MTHDSEARTVRGKASIHDGYSGYTTAARAVNRGAIIEVSANGKTKRLKVVDACGRKMRPRWGRVLDLSPTAFRYFFGSTRRGVGKVSYRVIKNGTGAYCGAF